MTTFYNHHKRRSGAPCFLGLHVYAHNGPTGCLYISTAFIWRAHFLLVVRTPAKFPTFVMNCTVLYCRLLLELATTVVPVLQYSMLVQQRGKALWYGTRTVTTVLVQKPQVLYYVENWYVCVTLPCYISIRN